MHNTSAQSSLEYLTTYVWAIIIVAVVIGILYALGLFGSSTSTYAKPGGCQVYRPNGPDTTEQIGLTGFCGNLQPQFVAKFAETPSSGAYIQVNSTLALDLASYVTVTAWVRTSSQLATNPSGGTYHDIVSKGGDACKGSGTYALEGGSGSSQGFQFCVYTSSSEQSPSYTPLAGTWYFVAGTYNGYAVCLYVNGASQGCTPATGSILTDSLPLGIGTDFTGSASSPTASSEYNGSIADVQLYGTALTANDILQLYNYGIGGDPSYLTAVVGWWPLNGNENDYSGNMDNGQGTGVTFTGTQYTGYAAP